MCDEFVCSDSGVVSLCEDDRKLLASLGAKKSQQIHEREETREEKGERGERGERDDHSLDKRKNNLEKLVPLVDSQWSLQSLLVRMF